MISWWRVQFRFPDDETFIFIPFMPTELYGYCCRWCLHIINLGYPVLTCQLEAYSNIWMNASLPLLIGMSHLFFSFLHLFFFNLERWKKKHLFQHSKLVYSFQWWSSTTHDGLLCPIYVALMIFRLWPGVDLIWKELNNSFVCLLKQLGFYLKCFFLF